MSAPSQRERGREVAAVVGGAAADIGDAAGLTERDLGGELVVLADEQDRQLPQRCTGWDRPK